MKRLISLCLFILCIALPAKAETTYFKGKPLFEDPIAYKRSPESGIALKQSQHLGKNLEYLEASVGKNIPIVGKKYRELVVQAGIGVGVWMTLGYDEGSFPMLTQDFLLFFLVNFKFRNLSWSFRYNHISAHLGDGIEALLEEEFPAKEGIEPFAFSREFFSAHVAYNYSQGKLIVQELRFYLQVGYAFRIIPDDLGRYFVGGGIEGVAFKNKMFPFYGAVDITYNADADIIDLSTQLGVFLLPDASNFVTMRLGVTTHIGSDRRGQMIGKKLQQIGIGLFVR